MSFITDAAKGIRMAGAALGNYLKSPATYEQLGRKVALETALGTAVQQAVPRMLNQPAPPLAQSIGSSALHSAFSQPITGAMESIGAPQWAAQMTGGILGSAGASVVSQGGPVMHNMPASQTVQLESPMAFPQQQQMADPRLAQLMELQRMQDESMQKHYNGQINLAYAKNYKPPAVIIHKNPSADTETIYRTLNPNVGY